MSELVTAPSSPQVTLVSPPRRAPRSERVLLGILSAAAILVLAIASSLAPDPRGFGTHEKLGLPPCGLLRMTGIPCPSCGMTTSFAHAVRLELVESARAQPLGLLLAFATAALAIAGPVLTALGTPAFSRIPDGVSRRAGFALLAAIVLAWAYKIVVTLKGAAP
jgi:hypothetical protein